MNQKSTSTTSATNDPILAVDGVSKNYSNFTALKSVDLTVEKNEFLTFLGSSGSGKTTLLKLIAGLTSPTSGNIFIDKKNVTALPVERRDIGFVFQNYALFPHLNVADNIAFGLKLRKLPDNEIKSRTAEMLDLVDLTNLAGRFPSELSGGQQQRVAIARALAPKPKVMLLDEPLGALDRRLRQRLGADLRRIQQEAKITAIYVTHDQEEAFLLSDRVAVLEAGDIVQLASPREVYANPANFFIANFVGEVSRFPGKILSVAGNTVELSVADRTLRATTPQALTVGQAVECVIRPERLRVVKAGTNPASVAGLYEFGRGTVMSTIFLGNRERLSVLSKGIEFRAELEATGAQPFAPGDLVDLYWDPNAVQTFNAT
jgi:ABC-type Fe3+/spermidine/putrescine transport system ATPase subunit